MIVTRDGIEKLSRHSVAYPGFREGGINKRAEVRRLISFERFICVRENLVRDSLFIFSWWRDSRIRVM